ncbi:MAG: asparagine--tRNA ligase [Planctomycetes bacterium]|nr:asparagine--tRNA ligase [Planctomycetota bacterium]
MEDLGRHAGATVTVKGWLMNRRSSGKLHFLQVRDGTGVVQAVCFKGNLDAETFRRLDLLPLESSLEVTGLCKAEPRASGGFELDASGVRIHQEAEPYPIGKKEHGTGFLMEHRHLWLRSSRQHAVLRVRARVIKAIRDFLDERGFVCMDSPIFTPSACEGTTTLFPVDYFGETAYLTQSGQLYAEASAMAFGKVYCFGPTFRAEKSKTRRHLTEFWMVEPEVAFLEMDGLLDLIEEFIAYVVAQVLKDRRAELEVLERDISRLERVVRPFPRISYDQAVALLHEKGQAFAWGGDFGAPDETLISEHFDRPVLVHRYPAQVKAFYMKRDPADDRLALCVDVLAPEGYGEIVGGSERASDLAFLLEQIKAHQLPEETFRWYLDLRRYGSVPHAGFGLGVERTTAWICGVPHLRECIPYPRMLEKITP